jgi:hypothetical protein
MSRCICLEKRQSSNATTLHKIGNDRQSLFCGDDII